MISKKGSYALNVDSFRVMTRKDFFIVIKTAFARNDDINLVVTKNDFL